MTNQAAKPTNWALAPYFYMSNPFNGAHPVNPDVSKRVAVRKKVSINASPIVEATASKSLAPHKPQIINSLHGSIIKRTPSVRELAKIYENSEEKEQDSSPKLARQRSFSQSDLSGSFQDGAPLLSSTIHFCPRISLQNSLFSCLSFISFHFIL